jgi:hypothetical protein
VNPEDVFERQRHGASACSAGEHKRTVDVEEDE